MNVSHLVPQSCSQAVGSPLTDSGYDSALTSPRPFTEPSGGSTPNAAAEAAGSQPAAAITEPPVIHRLGTIQGLQRFDTTLSNDTLLRFNDIQERIKGPLLACLRKTRKEFRPMAIRVVSLGHDQNSARPWIVVLCPDTVRKKIEKFFQSDLAMRLCKPNDTSLISFEVAVVGQPPREKAMEQNINVDVALMGVTTNDRPHWAFRVKVDHNQQNRFATMDGYVVVTDSTGTESIYGVTAGHVLVQDTHDGEQSYSDESMSSDEGTPDCPSWLDGRTTERDNTMDSAGNTEYNDDTFGTGLGETHQSTAQWSSLGQLSEASFSSKARNRDWALIENLNVPGFENSAPPLLVEKFYSRAIPISDNDFLRGVQFGFGPSHGFSSCTSCLPAILVLPYGTEFVNVNVLALGGDRSTFYCRLTLFRICFLTLLRNPRRHVRLLDIERYNKLVFWSVNNLLWAGGLRRYLWRYLRGSIGRHHE
jgi:hypothetical protein